MYYSMPDNSNKKAYILYTSVFCNLVRRKTYKLKNYSG